MSQFSELETSTAIRVRRAKITDITGILAVHDLHLLAKKDSVNATNLADTGFLVNSLSPDQAKAIITDKTYSQFFVATQQNEVIGFAFGCDVKKLSQTYQEKMAGISPELHHIITAEKAFYLSQIAKIAGKHHAGAQLLEATETEACVGGYSYIVCQIVEQPVQNMKSKAFHEKHGFVRAGFEQFGAETAGIYLKHI
jgi:predicted GNAT superfamily acetyltransferase